LLGLCPFINQLLHMVSEAKFLHKHLDMAYSVLKFFQILSNHITGVIKLTKSLC